MIKPGDILFTFDKGSVLSRAIYYAMRLFQKKKFPKLSHVAYAISDTHCVEADFKDGVIKSPLSKYLDKPRYRLIIGRYKGNITKMNQENIIDYVKSKQGNPYSWLQIVLIVLGKGISRLLYLNAERDGYDCSELISEAYTWNNKAILPGITAMHTPADLYLSPKLTKTRLT